MHWCLVRRAGPPRSRGRRHGRGCNTIAGRFQVHQFELDGTAVSRALVSFEQHCENGAAMLSGCVRYER